MAVINHKQTAVLVPTTLLAEQHYENFCDRFANWPIRIESLSRFKTAKQQQAIIQALGEGKIDIVIGTHKLLQEDVKWKDLGLLIVDEEHRFGVRQKERIKAMRANIDILTLTATPIPRTLNMAMSGMRDLSIIATPPARRLAVKTFVREYDDLVIREAILREILRGGQIYYLHNDVSDIEKVSEKLAELVPEARIAIGHGQMHERDLERVMNDFHHQRFNLLVCTTIVETGIDIPNANTIIIERADKFGLAQLHQLRGRVGRSYHQAYAYLLTPHPKLLSKDAKKRLEAIASLEDLGAGFALATHDLEIRGAGELLGSDQSGQIETIGFNLYIELLNDAVKSLKEGKEPTMLGDGLATSTAGLLGGPPCITYAEVIGAVTLTRNFKTRVMTWAAIWAILMSFVGKIGAFLSSIPTVVMGGIMVLLFGSIASVGINILVKHKVDLSVSRNMCIVSLVLVFGIGGMIFDFGSYALQGISLCGILAIVLNLILPHHTKPTNVG